MIFDGQGYLTLYELIASDLDTIEAVFVKPFSNSVNRRVIFEALRRYLTELKATLNTLLEIWIDGSFTTQKRDPNDVDRQVAMAHQTAIYRFRQRRYEKKSMTDGYFVETVPKEHPDYTLYQFDRQDWHRAFVFGRDGKAIYK